MGNRIHIILSDDLSSAVDRVVEDTESNRSEVLRKALHLLVAAHDGKKRDLKLCLVHSETQKIDAELIGL